MPTKYDTNPLDPDFPEKARAAAEAEAATQVLAQGTAATRPFAPETEDATRRFTDPAAAHFSAASPATYMPPPPPAYVGQQDESIYRKIEKIGLPENMLIAAPYIPWYFGLAVGAVLLFLVPRSEAKVRFHAAQGVAAHAGILLVQMILGFAGEITDLADIANVIFSFVTSIMLVVFAIKAWRGKPVHIESVEGMTNWLEEKVSPKLAG